MTPLGVVESTNGFQVNMIPLFPYWSFPLEITWHTRQPPEPQAAGPRQQDRPITTGPETTPFLHHATPSAERAQLQQTSPYIRLSEGFWEVLGYMSSTTSVSRECIRKVPSKSTPRASTLLDLFFSSSYASRVLPIECLRFSRCAP